MADRKSGVMEALSSSESVVLLDRGGGSSSTVMSDEGTVLKVRASHDGCTRATTGLGMRILEVVTTSLPGCVLDPSEVSRLPSVALETSPDDASKPWLINFGSSAGPRRGSRCTKSYVSS